jgi:tRNA A-37 threonylcarbamoyl transferase component Bud32
MTTADDSTQAKTTDSTRAAPTALHESTNASAALLTATARAAQRRLPALEFAARSILESQAIGGSVASVVQERALDHHFRALFQYAAIRTSAERANELIAQLENESDDLFQDAPPAALSPQAKLYAHLRALIQASGAQRPAPDAGLWWKPPHVGYNAGLVALRRQLSDSAAEIAELVFARRLRAQEVAGVVGISEARVAQEIAQINARAEQVLGRRPLSRDHTVEGGLLEAFALDPARIPVPRRRPRAPVLAPGSVLANRYEIEGLLGAGTFADVYRARDRDVTDHVVALKMLRRRSHDQRSIDSALRELQLIASVFHPSVVQLKDHGWHSGHLWFVMPLYRGETLATRLTRGPLSRREAREIFEPLAEALATMHRAGVRHQDVKPENVFLASLDPDAKSAHSQKRVLPVLLDLGVAAKDAELVLAGTPAYFAPEVAARFAGIPDPPPVGPKADVFSLALTLCHALDPSLREHVAHDAVDAFVALRATSVPHPPDGAHLDDLRVHFTRWLSFSPDERPSAEELCRELSALTAREERRARRMSTLRWALPSLVAVLAMFSAVVVLLSREAAIQRVEARDARARAAQAKQRAASIYASYAVEEARRRELEADVARLEREYQTSRMTRDELASRLAQSEAELSVLGEREKGLLVRLRQAGESEEALRSERDALSAARDSAVKEREDTQQEIDRLRNNKNEQEAELNRAREQLRQASSAEDIARARIAELEARLRSMHQNTASPDPARPNRHSLGDAL